MRKIGYVACTLLLGFGLASGCLDLETQPQPCDVAGASPDDLNPCTDDACIDGAPQHTPRTGGPCTLGSATGLCNAGQCTVECTADTDCPADDPCNDTSCDTAAGKCVTTPRAAGTPCATGQCDGEGSCADGCTDGVKNGTETDVDCGGDCAIQCADGKVCLVGTDCTSGFCVDGVCCESACIGTCRACNQEGLRGNCSYVFKGADDPNGVVACMGNDVSCDGSGGCLKENGQPCNDNGDCISHNCANGKTCQP